MRRIAGGRAVDAQAAPVPQTGRLETDTLAMPENRAALADLNGQWIDRFHDRNGLESVVSDMDSSVSPTHGEQEGAAWNGHSTAPAITRTSCSANSVYRNAVPCGMALSTGLMVGPMAGRRFRTR